MHRENLWTIVHSPQGRASTPTTADLSPVTGSGDVHEHLPEALACARYLSPDARIFVSVLEQEEPWWSSRTKGLDPSQIVEQPLDRGSAVGLLVPLLRIQRAEPGATVVMLTSEDIGPDALELVRGGLAHFDEDPSLVRLVGRTPDVADETPRVWIVPSKPETRAVNGLVFGPSRPTRDYLAARGALAATPVVVGTVERLVELFRLAQPDLTEQCEGAVSMDRLYPFLDSLDFYRDVLAMTPGALAMDPSPGSAQGTRWTRDSADQCDSSDRSAAV